MEVQAAGQAAGYVGQRVDLIQSLFTLPLHPTFWVTAIGWLSACFMKVLLLKYRTGDFQWNRFFGTGGMPSSHTAFAACLTSCIGISEGFMSAVFGLALGMTILTAVDAAGLRRSAGRQAELLNKVLDDLYDEHERPPRLKEALGHTLFQVLTGAAIGACVAFLLYPAKA